MGENECHRQAAVITQTLAGLTSPDHLFSFFDKLRALLPGGPGADMFADNDTAGTLTPESVFGIFLRKMILGFDLMRFSQVGGGGKEEEEEGEDGLELVETVKRPPAGRAAV